MHAARAAEEETDKLGLIPASAEKDVETGTLDVDSGGGRTRGQGDRGGRGVSVAGVILLAAAVATLVVIFNSGSPPGSPEKQGVSLLSGTFLLKEFDDSFEDYLRSLNVPSFLHSYIKQSREVVRVREPESPGQKWVIRMNTDYGEQVFEFHLDTPFRVPYGGGEGSGFLEHTCHRPALRFLVCTSVDGAKGLNIRSEIAFFDSGFNDTKTNVGTGVSTTKTYERIREEEDPLADGPTRSPQIIVPADTEQLWE